MTEHFALHRSAACRSAACEDVQALRLKCRLKRSCTRHGKTPVADEKKYLRAILRETRESMPAKLVAQASACVQSAFLTADFYHAARAIVLYSALGNEVSTDLILHNAIDSGRAVFYPRLERDAGKLAICPVASRMDLAPGAYGILEPATSPIEIASMPPCTVVVPGLAFTREGARLGRGGGHYDRLIAALPLHAITVGLAYSFQLLDHLPQSASDRRLSFVVTESAIHLAPDTIRRESGLREQGGNPR
jgi:5-formyltetrahydrofolate cyclo-ligase